MLTGQVLEVQGVEVLVKFSSDGPAAGTRWILMRAPLETTLLHAQHRRPGICLLPERRHHVCLGSKWSGEMPDFSKPADRTLVAQGHMIKAASNQWNL